MRSFTGLVQRVRQVGLRRVLRASVSVHDPVAAYAGGRYPNPGVLERRISEEAERFQKVLGWAPTGIRRIAKVVGGFRCLELRHFQEYLSMGDVVAVCAFLDLDGQGRKESLDLGKLFPTGDVPRFKDSSTVSALPIELVETGLNRVMWAIGSSVGGVVPRGDLEKSFIALLQRIGHEQLRPGYLERIRLGTFGLDDERLEPDVDVDSEGRDATE